MQNEELRRVQLDVDAARARYFEIYDLAPVGYCTVSALGMIVEANLTAANLLGVARRALVRQRISRFIAKGDQDVFYRLRQRLRASGQPQTCELHMRHADDTPFWGQLEATVAHEADGASVLRVVISDISESKTAAREIESLAYFDSLTNLPNRVLLLDHLKQVMSTSQRNGTFAALLYIDLDRFKRLNDTLGHDHGDLLLQSVAQRLTANVRECDTVARFGGDEFVVLLVSLSKNQKEAAIQTEVIGEKLLAALSRPYQLAEIDHHSTASIGATLFRGQEISTEALLKQADVAMYKTKESGRNRFSFFDQALQRVAVGNASQEDCLRHALRENEFVLHYQPQVAGDGRVIGSEALLRWRSPERGIVLPAEFIPLAERSGLILPLGYWVLETACSQLALWARRSDLAQLTIAVNVSARQFHESRFADKVLAILAQTGANPALLKLELTESLLVDNVDEFIDKVSRMKAWGIRFSLDDFGTGYSSLSYLKRLPLDQLKIDHSFVRDVLSDSSDAAIARTIVTLAHSVGLGVIAEGVDSEGQRAFLASVGCDAYQGYLFSRPLAIDEFEEFAREDFARRR
ncbi:GGDEF and EAL domain-containing protein [Candidatus Accumulibacter sp. ACC003]|uniref:putative bifunctional diguanylate cyclase/phosphodiesterase n=1 Tax=Candidatus Accumulibacter sp. ACC003 TaxID=2823334 RepID=UPI0025BEE9C2|nr:GGDEF and EAL domain-containing protein [Candidatus Accumulibacter sp. ACC003]